MTKEEVIEQIRMENSIYALGWVDAYDRVTEIINEHVTKWSDKRNGDPKVVKALDDILKEIASS